MARRFGGPRIPGKSLSNSFARRGKGTYSGNYDPAQETMQQALGAYGPPGGSKKQPIKLFGRATEVLPNAQAGLRPGGQSKNQSGNPGAYAGKMPRNFIKF